MRKRLQEIASQSGRNLGEIHRNHSFLSLFFKEFIGEGILPLSDLDIVSANALINRKYYSGERAPEELITVSALQLSTKYIGLYFIGGQALYSLF